MQDVAAMQQVNRARLAVSWTEGRNRCEVRCSRIHQLARGQSFELTLGRRDLFVEPLAFCGSFGGGDAFEDRLPLFLCLRQLFDSGLITGTRPNAISQVRLPPAIRRFDRIERRYG